MASAPRTDLQMQSVPGKKQTEADPNLLNEDMLPTDVESSEVQEKLAKETGWSKSDLDNYQDPPEVLEDVKSTVSIIFEGIIFALLTVIPALFVSLAFTYDRYDLSETKGPTGLNTLREFERWSYFFGGSFLIVALCELFFRYLPSLIIAICNRAQRKLSRHERTAVACLRYAEKYLGLALALILIVSWAERILYTPSKDLAAQQIFSRLKLSQRQRAYDLLFGERFESFLMAAFVLVFCLSLEKYLVAWIHESFHQVSLAPRIYACNAKFVVLDRLYRVRQPAKNATLSTAFLGRHQSGSSPGTEEDISDSRLAQDRQIDLTSLDRAKTVSRNIFKTLCPSDRNYIVAADFRPYFAPSEYEHAFQIFDTNRKGQLERSDFRDSVVGIYEERYRTATAILANSHIVRKLDWTLLIITIFFGLLLALIVVNRNGYSWVSSMGAFILGFSFLFQTTVTRVFDTFLFVFAEHAYDVSDNVMIDNERLLVEEIEIFTTIFQRNDGMIVYSPNSVLKGKTIYNRQRSRTEMDAIIFTVRGQAGIDKLNDIRGKLGDFLTETVNEFTGSVAVNVLKVSGDEDSTSRQATVKVEARYRPKEDDLRSELNLHNRRSAFVDKFTDIARGLDLDVKIVDADK